MIDTLFSGLVKWWCKINGRILKTQLGILALQTIFIYSWCDTVLPSAWNCVSCIQVVSVVKETTAPRVKKNPAHFSVTQPFVCREASAVVEQV